MYRCFKITLAVTFLVIYPSTSSTTNFPNSPGTLHLCMYVFRVVAALSTSIIYSSRFVYISDYFPLYPSRDYDQPSRPDGADFRLPTITFPSFLFPPSSAPPSHGTAHASGTNRTHGTGTDTGTGTDFHAPVEETLITSLQIPEFVGPGESDFLYCFLFFPFRFRLSHS